MVWHMSMSLHMQHVLALHMLHVLTTYLISILCGICRYTIFKDHITLEDCILSWADLPPRLLWNRATREGRGEWEGEGEMVQVLDYEV